ncbi:MAG: 16S rRNA (cytidine(1402)-2'-O)-methyltransferase [Patescibacteria group bacterium]|jgi:16S rRNA (cytidine1402-2'-O)-methyltransferase
MSTLYIVSTPIGNLEDMTLRALRILKEVDIIFCEDTRVTRKLLTHFEIHTPTESYHQHSGDRKTDHIVSLLREGKNLAIVSDAGTPGLSDPGGPLVHDVRSQLGSTIQIVPIPGASALAALIAVAGIPMDSFVFLGFMPHKKGRQTLFKEIAESKRTTIFYESPHRINKTLEALEATLEPDRTIVIGRELTKKFETLYVGSVEQVKHDLDQILGEFVVAVAGK